MLDRRFVRANLDVVRDAIKNKNERVDLDAYIRLDERRRVLLKEAEVLKRRRNTVSEEIAQFRRNNRDATDRITAMGEVSARIRRLDGELSAVEGRLQDILIRIPNIPHQSVPVGPDKSANVEIRRWGVTPDGYFGRRPHWEIGERLGILDFRRSGKIAGSHFILFKGAGAKLERALIQFMLDLHVEKHGYTEVSTPFVVNRQSMFGTGQLPKMEQDMYQTADDLFLIPTAEVPVTNIHREEIIAEQDLPIRYTAYSPCFRREAGSYGRETRGLIRVHQFDKVELVKFVHPDASYEELETLVQDAEEVLRLLNLPYRVMALSTGDLSFAASKCYDLEVWAPGVARWLEVSSCSNFEAFQARRAGIRFRMKSGKTRLVHTLNGSGLALPRTVIAVIENYQTADGAVRVPEALQPYMGGLKEIGRRKAEGGRQG